MNERSVYSYLTLILLPVGLLFVSKVFFGDTVWMHLPFHSFLETLGASVALITATIIIFLSHLRSISNIPFPIPLGFIGMGILDAFHAAVYVEDGFVWLHSLATFVGGAFFCSVLFERLCERPRAPIIVLSLTAVSALAVGTLIISVPESLPSLVVEGHFTALAYGLNLLGGIGFIAAGLVLNSMYLKAETLNLRLLAFLSTLFGISGLIFQLSSIWDATWWWWHLLRLSAYLIAFSVLFLAVKTAAYELKARKEELEQSKLKLEVTVHELESSRHQQDKIFAIVGHELRTPSATIDMLIDDAISEGQTPKNLEELRRQSKHLLSIIDDMKLSTDGRIVAETIRAPIPLNVYSTLEQSIAALRGLMEVEQFKVILKGDRHALSTHVGSAKAIQQIVQNLLKNAILHSEGDTAVVELEQTDLSEDRSEFIIRVSDNGKGISPEDQVKMFEAFERGSTSAEGLGLGLHICKELTELLLEGQLGYTDNPEGGAVFELRFVLNKFHNTAHQNKESTSAHLLQGKRVLLVEDTPTLRMLARKLLERQGALVQEAEDGLSALDSFERFAPDLVLTDIMMPNMDGRELTSALRKRRYRKPIIGVTGATVGNEAAELIDCGANRVLAKPLTVEALNVVLRELESAAD